MQIFYNGSKVIFLRDNILPPSLLQDRIIMNTCIVEKL